MEKILLIEDDESISQTVSTWLSLNKFNVRAVETGAEAMEELQFGKYDLILCDWNLPDMEGLDICQQFRAGGGTTPILMLSGNSSEAEKQQGLNSGATDYMRKPFDFHELVKRMRELIHVQE